MRRPGARSADDTRSAGQGQADRAIHIAADDLGLLDTLGVAKLLAAAVAPEEPDLILTGLVSDDLGSGQPAL